MSGAKKNQSPDTPPRERTSGIHNSIQGTEFQLYVTMYMLLRAYNQYPRSALELRMERTEAEVGMFDDIWLKVGAAQMFVQVKHSTGTHLTRGMLLPRGKDTTFSLDRFRESFEECRAMASPAKIREKWSYVLLTNLILHQKVRDEFVECNDERMLKEIFEKGIFWKVKGNEREASEDFYKEFILTTLHDLDYLRKLIKAEIEANIPDDGEIGFYLLRDDIFNWVCSKENRKNNTIQRKWVKDFFEKVKKCHVTSNISNQLLKSEKLVLAAIQEALKVKNPVDEIEQNAQSLYQKLTNILQSPQKVNTPENKLKAERVPTSARRLSFPDQPGKEKNNRIKKENDTSINSNVENVPSPTIDEVIDALDQLEGIETTEAETLAQSMHNLIVQIWETEKLPEDCKQLDKKLTYKVHSQVISNRLSSIFSLGRSEISQIFMLRQILQKCHESKQPTHHLIIEFNSDTMDRTELWRIMDEYNVPGKLSRLIKETMDSRVLLNLAIECALRRAGINVNNTIFKDSRQVLCHAGEMDIVGRTLPDVEEQYRKLKHQATKLGLKISMNKKYLLAGSSERDLAESKTIDGHKFKRVNEFQFLGTLMTSSGHCSRDIKKRIEAGIRTKLLYGHESWTLNQQDIEALEQFEPKILNVVKAGRLRWAGQLVRMLDDEPAKIVFTTNPSGRSRRGGPWLDQVEQDLKGVRCFTDWKKHAAENGEKWGRILAKMESFS